MITADPLQETERIARGKARNYNVSALRAAARRSPRACPPRSPRAASASAPGSSAGIAGAALVERAGVVAVARVADLEVAVAREEPAVPGIACGQHAVEEIDARRDRLDQVFGRAHAHQVARPVFGEARA